MPRQDPKNVAVYSGLRVGGRSSANRGDSERRRICVRCVEGQRRRRWLDAALFDLEQRQALALDRVEDVAAGAQFGSSVLALRAKELGGFDAGDVRRDVVAQAERVGAVGVD